MGNILIVFNEWRFLKLLQINVVFKKLLISLTFNFFQMCLASTLFPRWLRALNETLKGSITCDRMIDILHLSLLLNLKTAEDGLVKRPVKKVLMKSVLISAVVRKNPLISFVCFHTPVLRVSTNIGQWKEAASKVTHALVNVR